MQITWLGYNIKQHGDRLYSSAASVRYRLIIPARALSAIGHQVRILPVRLDSGLEEVLNGITGEVLVIPKLVNPNATAFEQMAAFTLELMRTARKNGQHVVVDISDNHFEHPRYGAHFRRMVNECDLVVASTPSMAEIIRIHTPSPTHVVSDPYEGARQSPRFRPPPRRAPGLLWSVLKTVLAGGRLLPLRLLWFGHGSNLESVIKLLPQLNRLRDRFTVELHLVTAADTGAEALCERFNQDYSPACKVRFSPWSVETTWRALEECDVVIIPSRLDDPAKVVKSPNRMIESIWAGRFVCANPVPSYQEFEEFAWVGQDVVGGVEWAVTHSHEVMQKLDAGQRYIARHYAPETLARQWETAFTVACQSNSAPQRERSIT